MIRLIRKKDYQTAFKIIKKPFKTRKNIDDRMFFVNYLRLWDKEDALHLAPSDEFYNLFQGN